MQTVVVAVDNVKIQELLKNFTFSRKQLKYREKVSDPHELPTPKECRDKIEKWFNDLTRLQNGTCKSRDCENALIQLDSFAREFSPGSPNIMEGSYKSCLELNERDEYDRKYCYLIQGDKNTNCRKEHYSILYVPHRTAFGVCVPEICHGKDTASIFGNMPRPFHFMSDKPICAAFCTKRNIPKKSMYYVFTSFVILLTSTVFFSSLYDYIRETRYRLSSETEEVFGQRAILAWSLWSNIVFLFRETRPGYIRSLDCIRTITFTWVVGQNVVGHLSFYDKTLRVDPTRIHFPSATYSSLIPIYTYMFMSGLTVSYTFIRAKPAISVLKRPLTWVVFYFHRWIRLTAALLVFIAFFDAYGKYIQGPYDALTGYSMVSQTDHCTYWKDIIHISNFVPVHEMCYLPAWHLAVDFQITLIAPVFMIAFYFSATIGILVSIATSLVSSGLTFLFYMQNDVLNTAFSGDHIADDRMVELILSKPWNQLTPYMIGMIVGYFLAVSAGSDKVLHPVVTGVIWMIVLPVGVASVMFGSLGRSQAEKAAVNITVRLVWSLCLSWIVLSTHLKWSGPISHFMEHPFWRPFGKLSYCAFIVHHMLLYHLFNMEDNAPKYVGLGHKYFHYTIPIVVYSYFAAFFLSMIVEVPFIRLDKILLDKAIPSANVTKEESERDQDKRDEDEADKNEEADDSPSEALLKYEF